MPLIPEGVIDEIQSRTDIADLIGRYMPLKRAGRHFKAPCPFHKEKTPSFMVNTDKQIFHCFGCGVGGNIFSFLMQHDRLTFPEAVQQLRAVRRKKPEGTLITVNGADPLNLVGILTPGQRVSSLSSNRITYRDGVPLELTIGKSG